MDLDLAVAFGVSLLFFLSGAAKLMPVLHRGLMAYYPVSATAIGAIEILLAITIMIPRLRRPGAVVGSVAMVIASTYVLLLLLGADLPTCGCWGGWVELGPWMHLGLNGILLVSLSRLIRWETPGR